MKKEPLDNRRRTKYVDQPPVEAARKYSQGTKVYAKTPAGPIVEVTVTGITAGGFLGCIGNSDISKLVLAISGILLLSSSVQFLFSVRLER